MIEKIPGFLNAMPAIWFLGWLFGVMYKGWRLSKLEIQIEKGEVLEG